MTLYNVHIYREMRLCFNGIEADNPKQAAQTATGLSLKVADDLDECDGETFAALVDVVGDDHYPPAGDRTNHGHHAGPGRQLGRLEFPTPAEMGKVSKAIRIVRHSLTQMRREPWAF